MSFQFKKQKKEKKKEIMSNTGVNDDDITVTAVKGITLTLPPSNKRKGVSQHDDKINKKHSGSTMKNETSKSVNQSSDWLLHHPRSLYYKHPPDFYELSLLYPHTFAPYVKIRANKKTGEMYGSLNFYSYESLHALTQTLLLHDFHIKHWSIPSTNLCPPVPQRLNYIHWIGEQLLGIPYEARHYENIQSTSNTDNRVKEDTSSSSTDSTHIHSNNNHHHNHDLHDVTSTSALTTQGASRSEKQRNILGIDIGVGASCIFPLLAVRTYPCMRMIGTDGDQQSLTNAQHIVDFNQLNDCITLIHNKNPKHIFHDVIPVDNDNDSDHSTRAIYDFTICNPPFFDSYQQASANQSNMERIEHGTPNELIYAAGGELGFITRMIEESIDEPWCYRVRWYTCMIGQKVNVQKIRHILWKTQRKGAGEDTNIIKVQCVQQYTFQQGKQSRWGIAWTYRKDVMEEFVYRQTTKQKQRNTATPSAIS